MEARRNQTGFSLMELMIAIVIVAVLAAIAFPSYQDHMRKSRRADAIADLNDIALREEQWRANDTDYGSLAEIGGAPQNSYYNFTVLNRTATTYTIRAAAIAGTSQAGDTERGTNCATLSIDQSGNQEPDVPDGSGRSPCFGR